MAVWLSVIVACILLDQLTKLWIFDGLLQGTEGKTVDVLGSFLQFQAVLNEGGAFGIGQDEGANIVFFLFTVVGLPLFCWLLWRSRTRSAWGQTGFAFIIGGTIGNAIDRFFVENTSNTFFGGKVRDFIAFSIFPPVFNIADSFLVVGVIFAIVAIVFLDWDGLIPTLRAEKAAKAEQQQLQEGNQAEPTQQDEQCATQQAEAEQTTGEDDDATA